VTYECAAVRLPDETLMVTATQTLVLIDRESRRPLQIPDDVRAPIRAFEGGDLAE
jgi:acyl-CoA thioesterase FadM